MMFWFYESLPSPNLVPLHYTLSALLCISIWAPLYETTLILKRKEFLASVQKKTYEIVLLMEKMPLAVDPKAFPISWENGWDYSGYVIFRQGEKHEH